MRRRSVVMILAVAAMLMGAMAPASATDAHCAGIDTGDHVLVNHGDHITGDYVNNGGAGGGVPAHFGTAETTPGASFCDTHGQGAANAASPTGRP